MKEPRLWKKFLCILLSLSIFVVGCGGHAANPVPRHMPGDEEKSCEALYGEMQNIDEEIDVKTQQRKDRDFWNITFFVTGFLVIVPWFFIDPKGSQEVEIDALKARKQALKVIFQNNNCTAPEASAAETTN